MTTELEIGLYIFILAGFLGYHVITRVPPLLHTPLMSATNAISGISLIGSLVVAGANYSRLSTTLGFLAVICSSTNVFGGFLITDRMLKMFKKREEFGIQHRRFNPKLLLALPVLIIVLLVLMHGFRRSGTDTESSGAVFAATALRYFYILSAVLFILGLKGLSSPKYARKGMLLAALGMLMAITGTLIYLVFVPATSTLFFVIVGLALLFGFLLVIPIGAADMPVVIALLNSYGGLADASMGFVLMNKIQIITGSLDGTSGFLLSLLMCRAMNRSAMNVLFGAFGKIKKEDVGAAAEAMGTVRSITPEELTVLFDSVRSVIIVPGYGMAVAQAQHGVGELAKLLSTRGIDVKYAIHPVAGRMPGHMNVLLAEANIPYDQLYTMEQINPYFPEADIALVVGANDVTNPAANNNKSSPLYGMPILEVDRAKSIIVLKRSLRPGFAGVDNDLYYNPKCMMLFGDAKESLNKLFAALKS